MHNVACMCVTNVCHERYASSSDRIGECSTASYSNLEPLAFVINKSGGQQEAIVNPAHYSHQCPDTYTLKPVSRPLVYIHATCLQKDHFMMSQ